MKKPTDLILLVFALGLGYFNFVAFARCSTQQRLELEARSRSEASEARIRILRENVEQLSKIRSEIQDAYLELSSLVSSFQSYDASLPAQVFPSRFETGFFCRSGHSPYVIYFWLPSDKQILIAAKLTKSEPASLETESETMVESKTYKLTGSGWHRIKHVLNENETNSAIQLFIDEQEVFSRQFEQREISTSVQFDGGNYGRIFASKQSPSSLGENSWRIGLASGKSNEIESYWKIELDYQLSNSTGNSPK